MKPLEVEARLPHPVLPGADWADCFEVMASPAGLTAEAAARKALAAMPRWAGALMALRNVIVRPFGLKGDPDALAHGPRIGMFPVISTSPGEIVLGLDDRHLDFRIVVTTEPFGDAQTAVRLMTVIRRHNRLGHAYLATIMPFHKLIVASLLSRV